MTEDKCSKCKQRDVATVPFYVYEGTAYRFERSQREMLKDRLLDGMTYDELSRKYYMSVRHIKSLIHRNKEIVFTHVDRLP